MIGFCVIEMLSKKWIGALKSDENEVRKEIRKGKSKSKKASKLVS